MHRIDILIIDDDEDDFLIVKSLLEDISHGPLRLDWAPNYSKGEELLAENRHAICLMDYQLGAKDGIELLEKAPTLGFSGPIILLTGIHQIEVDMLALEAGAVDYLVKNNLTSEQLARSIRYALGRREMEIERIERLRAEAENRSKSEFLAHLSHELRTPLSAILGFTELLINAPQSAENLSHLNIVHRNGKHLLGLLNDILDLSKIEAGKLDLEIHTLHLIPFIADVFSLMRSSAMDKNLQFNVRADSELPETILTDTTRLRQVLLNLIGNAIKFTNEGSVNVTVAVCEEHGVKKLRFSVQDSGIGIGQKNIDAIFKPFVQIKHARVQTRTGTGLGLTISRQLVKHLGGDIEVTSEENRGSCFSFTIDPGDLSVTPMRQLSLRLDASKPTVEKTVQFSGRILVVDDLRDIRTLIGHYVQRCGLTVEYAANGLEAVNKVVQAKSECTPYDLVFMDIHMPIKDGTQAAQEIRELGHTCPLIALTAAHMKGDQELYMHAGFNAVLSKPVEQNQVIQILEQHLKDPSSEPRVELQDHHELSNTPSSAQDAIKEQDAHQQSKPTILVVEDSEDALAATKNLLELLDWQTLAASNGQEALELVQEHQPSYALVDIHLPDMDGYELSESLLKVNPNIRIYLASGSEVDYKRANNTIQGHLLKPISLMQLTQLLNDTANHEALKLKIESKGL